MNARDEYDDAISKYKTYRCCTIRAKEELMTQQSQRPALPLSLRKKRARNILKRVIPCALLFALILAAIILRGEEIFDFPHLLARCVVYAICLLFPFVITGVPLKLIDKSFSGTVMEVKLTENTGAYSQGGVVWPYVRQHLVLVIRKDNGETFKYTALSVGLKEDPRYKIPVVIGIGEDPQRSIQIVGKIQDHEQDYSVGDRVHKYYGFRALWVTPQNSVDQKYCIVCGTKNDRDDSVCWSCRSELIAQ